MADISLSNITSGYNFNLVNANFVTLEDVVNDEVLHTTGGNNTMDQQLDMNSNRIINVGDAVNEHEAVNLGQARALTNTGSPCTLTNDGDQDLTLEAGCLNKFSVARTTADRVYTLPQNLGDPGIFYVIRNSNTSVGNVTLLAASGVEIDVSSDLGLIIPPGGIAELYYHDDHPSNGDERWHMFGYING